VLKPPDNITPEQEMVIMQRSLLGFLCVMEVYQDISIGKMRAKIKPNRQPVFA
jgi:hypothetical protein